MLCHNGSCMCVVVCVYVMSYHMCVMYLSNAEDMARSAASREFDLVDMRCKYIHDVWWVYMWCSWVYDMIWCWYVGDHVHMSTYVCVATINELDRLIEAHTKLDPIFVELKEVPWCHVMWMWHVYNMVEQHAMRISSHITLCHVMSCHIMSCRVWHAIRFRTDELTHSLMRSCHVMLCHLISSHHIHIRFLHHSWHGYLIILNIYQNNNIIVNIKCMYRTYAPSCIASHRIASHHIILYPLHRVLWLVYQTLCAVSYLHVMSCHMSSFILPPSSQLVWSWYHITTHTT